MSSREEILNRLRGNVRETYDFPDLGFKKLEFADPVAQYIETTTTTAGARVFEIKPTDDINAKIREAYPDARIIASNIPGVKADKNPDTVERAQDLEDVDVGVIKGEVACAENGCVWVPHASGSTTTVSEPSSQVPPRQPTSSSRSSMAPRLPVASLSSSLIN